jgi:hypothetical protein
MGLGSMFGELNFHRDGSPLTEKVCINNYGTSGRAVAPRTREKPITRASWICNA